MKLKNMLWLGKRRLKYLILKDQKCTFIFGAVLGALLAVINHHVSSSNPFYQSAIWPVNDSKYEKSLTYDDAIYDFAYEKWLKRTFKGQSCPLDPDILRYTNDTSFKNCGNVEAKMADFKRDQSHMDPRTEANFLFDKVNIACLVMSEDIIKSTAVRDTWGSHCNSLKFVSSKELKVTEEMRKKNHSILVQNPAQIDHIPAASEFALLCRSLRKMNENQDLEWILIIGEKSFAIPENLRYFVANKNPNDDHYLGHAMRFWNVIYNWADAGYVISKGTLNKLMTKFNSDEACDNGGQHWKNADWYLGKHLRSMNVTPVDTRDHIGRSRFIGHSLKKLLFPGGVSLFERYWRDSLYLSPDGPHCCSNFAITFHLSSSMTRMFQFYYLYYHLRAFSGGGEHGNQLAEPNRKSLIFQALTMEEKLKEEAWQKLLSKKTD